METKIKIDPDAVDYRSTRLVCAKLYEGGLLACNSIVNSIKKRPFAARSPEVELNMNLIARHAEKAFEYHLNYTLIELALASFSLIFSYINTILSSIFVILTIAFICYKRYYLDRQIALKNFSRKHYNPGYNLQGLLAEYNLIETDFCKSQNIITFGGYFPFLGSGLKARNWNFLIDTSKPSLKPDKENDYPTDISI
jgi:hypothetical protein